MSRFLLILSLAFTTFLIGCSTPRLVRKTTKTLDQLIESSAVFQQSFTGFCLLDPETNQILYEKDGLKFFTPASNTKLLTLFASLKTLPPEVSSLQYITKGDSLIFWGCGDPSTLHHAIQSNQHLISFLKERKEKLFFSSSNYADDRYGAGWAWDDYPYGFQPEKSPLPLYSNLLSVSKNTEDSIASFKPNLFVDSLIILSEESGNASIQREEGRNLFVYREGNSKSDWEKYIPFSTGDAVTRNILSSITGKTIHPIDFAMPSDAQMVNSVPLDTLLKLMMQDSDNFIAEQLLLQVGLQLEGRMNTKESIKLIKESYFENYPTEVVWRDGSGLSRYNLMSPRFAVTLLTEIYQIMGLNKIKDIFPAGGVSGTIKNWYSNALDDPYIFAKTGSLSNKHCLSGYLIGDSGKLYIFSFMNKDFIGSSHPIKEEMQKVLANLKAQL